MYRWRNERYVVFLNEIVSGGGDSVMVWAVFVHGYRSPLVVNGGNLNVQRYRVSVIHDLSTKRCTMRHSLNANITILTSLEL